MLSRYQVCHAEEGLIGHDETKADAFATAYAWESRCEEGKTGYAPGGVEVFDRMAHYGHVELWTWEDGALVPTAVKY